MANAQPTVDPWREPVLHRFNETHAGWVPIVPPPLWEASDENAIATATAQGIGQFTILSLAEFGQLSLQPSTSGSAQPAAVATETLVEVVAMATDPPEDPLPPLSESPIIEDDPILVDDDHTMPAPDNMVEWFILTLHKGVELPATLTLFWVAIQLYILIYFIWTTLCFPLYLL